jgi:peptidoglycan biosynthesis protein MviN/MurJ (putative lipid II flippase)
MLAMGAVTCVGMLAGVKASGWLGARGTGVRVRTLVADAGVLLARTIAYLAFNVLFVITLSFASRAAVGDVTVLSYAYLFASYLVAGTGMALGMGRIPEMTRGARSESARVIADTVPQGFRYAVLVVAPALAALITAGAPLIHEVFPASLNAEGVHNLRTFAALLAPWTVAALLVNFLMPAMFALGRTKLVNALAVPLVVGHVAITALMTWLLGTDGAVAAFFVAPLALGVTLLIAGSRRIAASLAAEMARDALRFFVLAAVAFGAGELVATSVGSGLPASLAAGLIGSALYVGAIFVFARRQVEVLVRTLRPAGAPA